MTHRKRTKKPECVYEKYVPPKFKELRPTPVFRRDNNRSIPSLQTNECYTGQKVQQKYTGENLIGIATMHKSNAVPVFKGQDAIDIAKMRRG